VKNKKICNGHFVVRLTEDARQSDQNQQQKQCLCRAFIEAHSKGAIYCRAFLAQAHDKEGSLSCVFLTGARQRGSHAVWFRRRQLLLFAVRREKTHGKDYLPCVVRRGAR
jgi:GH24 family phage-related lysozyme (muramidase)